MKIINVSIASNCKRLDAEVEAIERQLNTSSSSKTCQQVFQKLEKTSLELESLKERASLDDLPSSQIEEIGQRVKHLVKRTLDQSIAREVHEIRQKAGVKSKGKHEVRALKKHIHSLREKQALPRDTLKILDDIEVSLKKVDLYLDETSMVPFSSPPKHISSYEHEWIMELYEIFHLFSCCRNKEAEERFRQLEPHLQCEVRQEMERHPKDSDPMLKALVSTANRLAGKSNCYPTSKEIASMQKDLLHIRKEESQEATLCPFKLHEKSRRSVV